MPVQPGVSTFRAADTFTDPETEGPQDLTGLSVKVVLYRPDGSQLFAEASFVTNGSDGKVEHFFSDPLPPATFNSLGGKLKFQFHPQGLSPGFIHEIEIGKNLPGIGVLY